MFGRSVPLRVVSRMNHMTVVLSLANHNLQRIVATSLQPKRFYAKGGDNTCVECCKNVPQKKGRKVEEWPKPVDVHPPYRPECSTDALPVNNDPYRIKVPEVVVPPMPKITVKPMMDCKLQRGPCSAKPAPTAPPCPPPPPYKFPWIYPIVIGTVLTIIGLLYKWYLYRELQLQTIDKPVWRPRQKIKRPVSEKDLPPCTQYLIIGGGAAGWAGYQAIKTHDETAKVFIITKEDSVPYMRPPMSKHMWFNGDPPNIRTLNYIENSKKSTMYYTDCKNFMDPVKFYRKKTGPAVSIGMGWCVVRIDADEHVVWVQTSCGEAPIYYERLLLAPGSYPKNLSIFKNAPKKVREKMTTLRTIRDLEVAYRKVREAKHVTIIGGGYLGSELAWYLGRMPKEWFPQPDEDYVPPKIYHVYKDRGILAGLIPDYLGEWAAQKIKCENVTLMPNTAVWDAFLTEDDRLELTLSDGTSMVTDYVLVAIGAIPRTQLGKDSFLEVDQINGGYKVNTELEARTHVYVAGDAASTYSQWKNSRIRMDHYATSVEQGYIAGANMAGFWTPFNIEPHFWFELGHDISMEVIGEVGACYPIVGIFKPCDQEDNPQAVAYEKMTGEYERPCFLESESYRNRYKRGMLFYLRDNIVVGMVFWNVPPIEDRLEVVTEMLRAQPSYEDINLLAEQLGFPDLQCHYLPEEFVKEPGPCIDDTKSKWLKYEEHEKRGSLSTVEVPETVLYENKPL